MSRVSFLLFGVLAACSSGKVDLVNGGVDSATVGEGDGATGDTQNPGGDAGAAAGGGGDTGATTGGGSGGGGDTGAGGGTGTDPVTYSGLSGTAQMVYGFSRTPDDYDCEIYWDITSAGAPSGDCAECAWAFAVDFAYDDGPSYGASRCFDGSLDFTWELGLIEDYGSYGDMIAYGYRGNWYAWLPATWDGSTVTWEYGYYQYPYRYEGAMYYYTYQWTGSASVY